MTDRIACTLTRRIDCLHYEVGDVLKVDGVASVKVDEIDFATGAVYLRPLRWHERLWQWLRFAPRRLVRWMRGAR
jgi:hypothetical protein